MGQLLFSAIIICQKDKEIIQAAKYRNIPKNRFASLCVYAKKTFADLHHINLYEKETKRFYLQLKKTDIELYTSGTV